MIFARCRPFATSISQRCLAIAQTLDSSGRLGITARRFSATGFDPYAILGISRGSTKSEIKAAYRRAALRTHPDRTSGSGEAFRLAAQAYQALSNPFLWAMSQAAANPASKDWSPRESSKH